MIWLFDFIAFLAWIVLASQLMITEVEEAHLENWGEPKKRRGQGFREGTAVLGVLPIVGYLFAEHGILYSLFFLFVVNAVAFQMRFFAYLLPTWTLCVIAIISLFTVGYSYLWI